jgi:hypothetical protein
MNTKHKFTTTIIGFICGLVIFWTVINKENSGQVKSFAFKSRPIETTTNNSDLEQYRDEISYLQQDLKSLQIQLKDLQQTTQINQAENIQLIHDNQQTYQETTTNTNQDVELQPYQQKMAEKEMISAQLNTLDQQLQYEEPDPGWSYWAQNEILNSINNKQYVGVNVIANDCRSTMCRFQIQFDNTQIRDTAVGDIPTLVPWDSQGFFHADEDDPLNLVLYVSREGAQLAQIE